MPKNVTAIYRDLLLKLTFRSRPYEELPGEMSRLAANLEQESARILQEGSRSSFYALCDRTIATFETRSLVNDLGKPRIGFLANVRSVEERKHIANVVEKNGAEAVLIGQSEYALFENNNASLYAVWKTIYAMLAKSRRFAHFVYPKKFWKQNPSLKSYYELQGVMNLCSIEALDSLDYKNLSVNVSLREQVKPHAKTHAPNLCATHFSTLEPIQLSQKQMAMIEEAKREAIERKKDGV